MNGDPVIAWLNERLDKVGDCAMCAQSILGSMAQRHREEGRPDKALYVERAADWLLRRGPSVPGDQPCPKHRKE